MSFTAILANILNVFKSLSMIMKGETKLSPKWRPELIQVSDGLGLMLTLVSNFGITNFGTPYFYQHIPQNPIVNMQIIF